MPICRVADVDLFYAEKGEGEALVFLNGLAGDHLSWLGQLRSFGKEYHCLALDNRDSGQSTYTAQPYTIQTLASDVAGLLGQLGVGSAHVVGVSMGGMIAQELALSFPDLVQSLVLANTLARADDWFRGTLNAFQMIRLQVPTTAAFFDAVMPWWVSHRFIADSGRITWLRWLLDQNPNQQQLGGFERQLDAVRAHDCWSRLGEIRCPVLILAGEHDTVMPPRYSVELGERLPQARMVTIPGVGHALPIENPGRFNALVRDFLSSLPRPKAAQRRSA